jgi:hypothetical protein
MKLLDFIKIIFIMQRNNRRYYMEYVEFLRDDESLQGLFI